MVEDGCSDHVFWVPLEDEVAVVAVVILKGAAEEDIDSWIRF
jgi:hypothetical protein